MPVAVWSNQYETGIVEIDAQHQNLFRVINDLAERCKMGQAASGAYEALDFLNEYTEAHFHTEEEFMRVLGYPMLSFHQVEHTALLTKVQNLRVKMDEGFMITADVASFMADWLAHHINGADMAYVHYLKEKLAHLQ